ncbi:MAG: carbohydrate kinase family protein [Candidatus Delongbacteria bacterium]|nr:carbohydrate kinase family protein [Candidatus Delongbacteria bacterium]
MLLSIGNPVFDLITTPFIRTESRILSGCSINAAIVYRKLGGSSMVVGNIGPDYQAICFEFLEKERIDYSLNVNGKSGGFNLFYHTITERDLTVWQQADPITHWPCLEQMPAFILAGPILNEISLDYIEQLKSRFPHATYVLDPQGFLRRSEQNRVVHYRPENYRQILTHFDIIKPNELEAEILTGIDPKRHPREAMKAMIELSPPESIVIITLSDKGAMAYEAGHYFYLPAYPANAIDSTGVGDAFAGSLLRARAMGKTMPEQLAMATAASSFVVEQVGPFFEFPSEAYQARVSAMLNRIQEEIPDEL